MSEPIKDDGTIREPISEKPFPNNPGEGKGTDPRTAAVDDISARFEEQRVKDLNEAIATDPGLAANQKEMDDALVAENASLVEQGLLDNPDQAAAKVAQVLDDGAASREDMHHPEVVTKPALPKELQDDPLAEYIDMVDGRPMFRSKVDGEIVHTDLDTVRATQQKHEAADRRLQSAAEWQKDLQRREAALTEKEKTPAVESVVHPLPEVTAVDDLDITAVSKDIVASMFSGTEEEASAKLADTLTRISKRPAPAASQQIDADAIVSQATAAAREEIKQENYKDDVTSAWGKFTTDYKDVHDDPDAFALADSLTNEIELAHPNWKPQQVMMEAGERARKIVITPKAEILELKKSLSPAVDADRQKAKSQITPIPLTRNGVQAPEPEARPQTAREALDEIRRSRNQPS